MRDTENKGGKQNTTKQLFPLVPLKGLISATAVVHSPDQKWQSCDGALTPHTYKK